VAAGTTAAAAIELGSSPATSRTATTTLQTPPGGDYREFIVHFADYPQTTDVDASCTGAQIADQLYSFLRWTGPRAGWWWRPHGGDFADILMDDDDEAAWAKLVHEGKKTRNVWSLAPNVWAHSPSP
jgi:hypothetical protein